MTPDEARQYLEFHSKRFAEIMEWKDWLRFVRESVSKGWIYFIQFGISVFAWGTASGKERLRKSSIFHEKLSGKYDRRVDYLMLRIIEGGPRVWAFEVENPHALEDKLKSLVGNCHCFGGIAASNRDEVSKVIFSSFKKTTHWKSLAQEAQLLFQDFLRQVYFARRVHPENPKRTFHYGDSREPRFIEETLAHPEFARAIEQVLRVLF